MVSSCAPPATTRNLALWTDCFGRYDLRRDTDKRPHTCQVEESSPDLAADSGQCLDCTLNRCNGIPDRLASFEIAIATTDTANTCSVVACKGVKSTLQVVLPVFAVGINVPQRVVPGVAVLVPTLRVREVVRELLGIGTGKPALRPTVVSRSEVIEARFRISFFAGKLPQHYTAKLTARRYSQPNASQPLAATVASFGPPLESKKKPTSMTVAMLAFMRMSRAWL